MYTFLDEKNLCGKDEKKFFYLEGLIMTNFLKKKCVPCEKGTPPVVGKDLEMMFEELGGGWKLVNDHHLEKEFPFKDFAEALTFTNQVGALAEKEGHHPDIHLTWGKVRLIIWTHKINGLSENDFILAAKCDEIMLQKQSA